MKRTTIPAADLEAERQLHANLDEPPSSLALLLHLHAQVWEHTQAGIVGTREALVDLGYSILLAAQHGEATMDAFAGDGEGYRIAIERRTTEQMLREALPYSGDRTAENIQPGDPIADIHCSCCGAHLEIAHGDDPGEISVIGTQARAGE